MLYKRTILGKTVEQLSEIGEDPRESVPFLVTKADGTTRRFSLSRNGDAWIASRPQGSEDIEDVAVTCAATFGKWLERQKRRL